MWERVISAMIGRTLLIVASLATGALAEEVVIRVACVGDSITEGHGLAKGDSHPEQLQEMLGGKWKVGNFGKHTRTVLKKGDFPYWNEKVYQDALEFRPDVVVILLGTNDSKPRNWVHEAEFTADYRQLVESFLELPEKPRVFAGRPCPVPEPGNFEIVGKNLEEVRRRIDKVAEEMDLEVIDLHTALEGKLELLPDKVHPNAEGARELAKAAHKALTSPAP